MELLFVEYQFQRVVYFVVQVGVCYFFENFYVYVDVNLVGFMNILEGCCYNWVEYLVYVFSSLVYGVNEIMLFFVYDNVDYFLSFYVVFKKVNELMVYIYSYFYNLFIIGL